MEHLANVSVEDLQQVLDSVDKKTPAQRLIAAIAYKNGITQSELAEWFDVERKTIYNWLTRIEKRDLEAAIHDEQRPGRPRKLSDQQLVELEEILHNPPTEVGLDAPAWTTKLLQNFLRDRFNVDYSPASCRRLMREAGMSHRTASKAVDEVDLEEWDEFDQELRNLGHVWVPS